MKSKRPSDLEARWTGIMQAYRRRCRQWVMTYMPTMPDDQWQEYERWVANFGVSTLTQSGRHGRKVKRELRAAKRKAGTVPVPNVTVPVTMPSRYAKMRFSMGMVYEGTYWEQMRVAARAPDVRTAKVKRATRR